MYNAKSLKAEEFISDEEIRETLAYADANKDNVALIDEIIEKAKLRKGLNHREASVLLACEIPEKIQEVYALAEQIKKDFSRKKSDHSRFLPASDRSDLFIRINLALFFPSSSISGLRLASGILASTSSITKSISFISSCI